MKDAGYKDVGCYRVGLTGGIGAGKTTVGALFAAFGVEVIDADEIARAVTRDDRAVLRAIAETLGARFIDADGGLDRAATRRAVFADAGLRKKLEGILHPVIRSRMEERAAACEDDYCILSVPLLLESGAVKRVDRVLVVDAPDEVRRARVRRRSGLSEREIDGVFAVQWERDRRLAAADDVIVNDGGVDDLDGVVETLHGRYLRLARARGNQS